MSAQQKREQPEYRGKSQKNRPEIRHPVKPRPETTGRDEPGAMPENPASIDHVHEPAGIQPGTDRTQER